MTGRIPRSCFVVSAVTIAVMLWTSAVADTPTTESRTVQAGSATSVTASLKMHVGDLVLRGGADALLDAAFSYAPPHMRPEVTYDIEEDLGILVVRQLVTDVFCETDTRSAWDLRLGDMVPITLNVDVDAGGAALDLRALELRDLDVDLGAGDLDLCLGDGGLLERANANIGAGTAAIDLSGEWHRDCYVRLNIGVGDATIVVPRGVGVRLRADVGIGAAHVEGLSQAGDDYRNDEYGTSPTSVIVAVNVGVGEIRAAVGE